LANLATFTQSLVNYTKGNKKNEKRAYFKLNKKRRKRWILGKKKLQSWKN
jgi:hypothetical protein